MKTKKMILVLVAVSVTVLCGVSMAGSKINAWVIDDFESYDSTVGGSSPMKAYDLTSGGPWFILQELQVALG
ncbi:MAG: hypothetical protein K9M75_03000, partial [Phycisphaerae bacterium]|nr:hypothetical protein [Phycisphaerae bacterium]